MKVLLLEDEAKLAEFVIAELEAEGFSVDWLTDGTEALERASSQCYDALVLDIMVRGRDGLGVLARLRKAGNGVPVVITSARGELDERLEGLNSGADDYLAKPFSVEELTARLKGIWRRSGGAGLSLIAVGPLTIDLMKRVVRREGAEIELTNREFELLVYLARHPERVRTRTQLLEQVWDYNHEPGTNLVDVCIRRLRKKIDAPGQPSVIEAVRGVGYKLSTRA